MLDIAPRHALPTRGGTASVAELAARDRLSYAEAVERLQKSGKLLPRDPRAHLSPARVRSFASMPASDLLRVYGRLLDEGARSAPDREARLRYLAARRHHKAAMAARLAPADQARALEKGALHLSLASPSDARARKALEMSAGLSDRMQRERATRGFSGPSPTIAKAAKVQGRSWIEVRDDLVRFGVLKRNDPRATLRTQTIRKQKGGLIRSRSILPSEKLEKEAMKILRKKPKDAQAMTWLATAGALEDARKAKKVKGVLPPRKGLLRGIDLGL